ncbi:MAG: PaaI family thioesterase [Sandaracinaceae bacterium]
MSSIEGPIQDRYAEDVAHCFGCGRLNGEGHQLKTVPEGDHTVARFTPAPAHTAIPGYVYGGLLASLVDCHGTGTAAWAAHDEGGEVPRFVTAKLEVQYVAPTPLGPELTLVGRVRERSARKVVVDVELSAEGVPTVRGVVVAVRMPASFGQPRTSSSAARSPDPSAPSP